MYLRHLRFFSVSIPVTVCDSAIKGPLVPVELDSEIAWLFPIFSILVFEELYATALVFKSSLAVDVDNEEAPSKALDVDWDFESILTSEQREQLKTLLQKHKDLFSTSDTDIGTCTKTKHRINLHDETPFKMRHRRIPPNMVEEVRAHLEQLLSCGIITPSKSPWASPVVLVRKKNGTLRMCIDFRNLNVLQKWIRL